MPGSHVLESPVIGECSLPIAYETVVGFWPFVSFGSVDASKPHTNPRHATAIFLSGRHSRITSFTTTFGSKS